MRRLQVLIYGLLSALLFACGGPKIEFRDISWKELASFAYTPSLSPLSKKPHPVSLPRAITGLNGRSLRVVGYMMPVEMDGENVASFVLVRNQALCCYGKTPAMNEWVLVRFRPGTAVPMNMDRPLAVEGTFEVGEQIEEGAVVSLYRMVAERVEIQEGKPTGWQAN
ncbi:DUF3299 domain-containing protein [bacterium]|nr:DUF3299 domain-containing protein [bacterium]